MSEIKIKTSLAAPGMVVARDIYSSNDQLIVSAGTALTDRFITRLKFYSVSEIEIIKEDKSAVTTKRSTKKAPSKAGIPSDGYSTHLETIKSTSDFQQFTKSFYSSFMTYKDHLNKAVRGETALDTEMMLNNISEIFASCQNPSSLFDMLMGIRNLDDVTYVHSMNVALICNLFAVWLKFSPEETRNLVLAGLLHDIGKMLIPKSIITKPSKLTEEEYAKIKNHSLLGYNILKNQKLDSHICLAALQHHERSDGSGYPMGLSREQLDPYARIVAIADVYDALTAARVYRGPICPLEVIGIFQSEGLSKYDPQYLMIFLEGIMNSYMNHTVRLSNGETGRIVLMQRNSLSRPVVYISENHYIDLAKQTEITVTEII